MTEPLRRLALLVDRLRRECPWDREQSFATLQTFLLEETHEVLEALDGENSVLLRGELGDLLFQIFFLSRLAEERGWFDIDDVATSITEKMIERHPHVFGDERASDAGEVKASWEKRKREGRDRRGDPLGTIPRSLPSLSTALRMSERAADLGFDWERDSDLLAKVEEEIREVRESLESAAGTVAPARRAEVAPARRAKTEEELGDLLFAIANWGRKLRIDPEKALRLANEKFRRRFHRVAQLAHDAGRDVAEASAAELDVFWNRVKDEERSSGPKPDRE